MFQTDRLPIIFVIISIGLSACAAPATPSPAPTETALPPTLTPSPIPTETPTIIPEPTATAVTAEHWQALSPEERLTAFPESLNETSVSRRLVGDGSLGIAAYFDKDGHITEGYDIFAKKEIPLMISTNR